MMRLNYAIVFVSDMSRSIEFYRDVIGVTLKFETPEWSEFDTGEATLALHKAARKPDPRDPNDPTAAGQCNLGFSVENIDAFHSKMSENGVVVDQEPREVFGIRIAQYLDPDGMILAVSETEA